MGKIVVVCGAALLTGWGWAGEGNSKTDGGSGTGAEARAAEPPVMLFPIVKGGKWGYMDEKGKGVIEPQYELAWDFHEGLACVGKDALRGYIDPTGKLVIPILYGWAGDFSEGLARVDLNREKFGKLTQWYQACRGRGYVDKNGKLQVSIGYGTPFPDFSGGVALIQRAYLGRDGKPIAFDGDEGSSFTEGLAAVRKGVLWGYMDRTMKPVIEPRFHAALWFSDGLAAVGIVKEVRKRTEATLRNPVGREQVTVW